MSMRTLTRGALTGLALATVGALPASAQQVGWSPWIGCWQADGGPEEAALCVRRSAEQEGAVEILRVEGQELLDRELVWADGVRHETVRDECQGWEEGRFSRDGRRLLLRSSHTCEDGLVQEGGGIMTMAAPDEWLDVRYLEVAEEPTAWVQRYRPAPLEFWEAADMAELASDRMGRIRAARNAAAEAPDVDDVIEASALLPAPAVEAWIAEKGDPFHLDAEKLVAMADAGVADRVIDVVVAVSNPDVFALASDGPERVERDRARAYRGGLGRGVGVYDPFYYNRLRYSGYYGYGYSPFGYGGWGYYGPGFAGYGYRPTVVVVDRRDTSTRRSRVIAGRGYRNPGSSGSGGGFVRPDGASSGSSGSAGSSRPSSTRPSTPRKAKPRKPGGSGGL